MTTDEVVGWLIGLGHLEQLDESGRPLGEAASAAYASTPHDEQVRAFGDSRDETGLPCNLAALAQLRGHWDALLTWVGRFESGGAPTMGRLARRANAATRVAPLMALRDGVVSVEHAALFKAFLGFNEVAMALLIEERVATEDVPPPVDAWLDERPWLIGDVQVCAGTRAQIRRAWDALSTDADGEGPEPWVVDAWAAARELEALCASAAGAARVALVRGTTPAPIGERLFRADRVPRCVEALRSSPAGAVAHPTLLFEPDAVPRSLMQFVEAVVAERDADLALVEAAADPAARLMSALGLDARTLTLEAFSTQMA